MAQVDYQPIARMSTVKELQVNFSRQLQVLSFILFHVHLTLFTETGIMPLRIRSFLLLLCNLEYLCLSIHLACSCLFQKLHWTCNERPEILDWILAHRGKEIAILNPSTRFRLWYVEFASSISKTSGDFYRELAIQQEVVKSDNSAYCAEDERHRRTNLPFK
jgi:hypothetical protein